MGTLYLVDSHTPVLLDSEINDTIPVESGQTQAINGSFPVNVPFGVPIDGTPTNLTDLLSQKFAGLLAAYPGYTSIDYDEGIDDSGWDTSTAIGVTIGKRGATCIRRGFSSVIISNTVVLGWVPAGAILTWEAFSISGPIVDDAKDGILTRSYEEVDSSEIDAYASFDGGTSWVSSIADGVYFSIPAWQQGSNFKIRFNYSSGAAERLWIGSWAVIY